MNLYRGGFRSASVLRVLGQCTGKCCEPGECSLMTTLKEEP